MSRIDIAAVAILLLVFCSLIAIVVVLIGPPTNNGNCSVTGIILMPTATPGVTTQIPVMECRP